MRMIHVIESLKPEAGSVAISLAGLFPALIEEDIQSEVITLDGVNPSSNGKPSHVQIHRFDPDQAAGVIQQADLVHLHGWDSTLCKSMATIAKKQGIPYVLSPHGELTVGRYHPIRFRDKLRGLLGENKLIRSSAALVSPNKKEAGDLSLRGLNNLVKELPHGLTFSDYEKAIEPPASPDPLPEGKYILLLAPIDPVEGCVVLLKAIAELGPIADDWSIVLAGQASGDWRKMLEAAVRRKGGQDRVIFVNASDITTQQQWLSRASMLVAPGLHVRPSVSLLQAIAMGIPVLASECVAPKILTESIHVFGPTKPQLQRALRSAFEGGEEVLQTRAKQALQLGAKHFDWPVHAKTYAEFYRSLIH